MDQLFKSFGIEGKLLLWQVVNFGILFGALWLAFYKPVKKIMREREGKISESLKQAETLRKKTDELENEFKSKMMSQREELESIHKKIISDEEKLKKELKQKAGEEAEKILAEAKIMAAEEKAKTLAELEADVKKLAVALAAKILEREIDEKSQKKFIDEALEVIKKQKNRN